MLIVFFVVPFAIMIAVSFFQRDPAASTRRTSSWTSYARFLSAFFGGVLGFSLGLACWSPLICVVVGFPFTYPGYAPVAGSRSLWLVALLSVLSLSEVIIGFAWSTLFSRTAGITNLLVWLGLMDKPVALRRPSARC